MLCDRNFGIGGDVVRKRHVQLLNPVQANLFSKVEQANAALGYLCTAPKGRCRLHHAYLQL